MKRENYAVSFNSLKEKCQDIDAEKELACLERLICEHDELTAEYKKLYKTNSEQADIIRESIFSGHPCRPACMPVQAYKFDDLKANIWVYDKKFNEVCFIEYADTISSTTGELIKLLWIEYLKSHKANDYMVRIEFEENRFFPLTMYMSEMRCNV